MDRHAEEDLTPRALDGGWNNLFQPVLGTTCPQDHPARQLPKIIRLQAR